MTQSVPPIHFAPAGGGRIAYQFFGRGPVTLVSIPPTAQNIEMAWDRPEFRRMFDRFASFSSFLHFDKRGTGASDRRSRIPGLDERVDDLRAVMDHADIDRAHMFVSSEGGPMAILFAATYPDRVASLTLWGSGASMLPADLTEEERAEHAGLNERFAALWGTSDSPVVDGFAPSLASNQEYRSWHQRYERAAASTDSLRDLLDLTFEMDVREILPTLDVPTLVLHRTGDRVVSIDLGRELAENIPGARLIELDGEDHFAYAGDLGWMADVERFVTGEVQPREVSAPNERQVRVETLGRFAVVVNGEDVPPSAWGSRRARQVAKRLVAARGWPVTRDEFFELLWPGESDRGKLGARLSVQLSAVRRVLGGGVIADRQSVRLDLSEISTDLEGFHSAVDDAAVVAAYTGEFLPDDVYDDWTGHVRDEVRSRFVAAARQLSARYLGEERYSRAIAVSRRLIEVDRYDEAAHHTLAAALVAAGEKGEAKRARDAWEAAMAELGVPAEPFEP